MDYDKDNMTNEDMRTSSDSEEEAIASVIDDDDDDGVRYSLRSRTVPKSGATMIAASTGTATAAMASQVPSSEDTCATTAVSNSAGDRTNGPDAQMRPRHARALPLNRRHAQVRLRAQAVCEITAHAP